MEYGWNTKISKVKYLWKIFTWLFAGFGGTENDKEDSFDSFNTTAVVGIRFRIYLLLMRGIDNELRPRISLEEV
jgi:hypothetical protein